MRREGIQWREFDVDVFEEARRLDRPVLLVLTAHWCPHCRELLDVSFAASEVQRAVDGHFLPILADAERRPDVNERYGRGAWPTLAYLTPEGELISHDGFLSAEELAQRLRKVARFYMKQVLPKTVSLAASIVDGSDALADFGVADF